MLQSKGEKAFNVFNICLMTFFCIVFTFPILFVIKTSLDLSPLSIDLSLWPGEFTLLFYKMILNDSSIYRPFLNSVIVTVVGTVGAMCFNCMGGYALSKRNLPGMQGIVYFLVVIPMFIGGGLVAGYLLIKALNWFNTYRVLIIPGMISAMNMIIIRNYFWTIPKSLIEAAKIDGAGEFTVFVRIMVPLSKSVISATTLFTGVGYWNSYFNSILYNEANMRTFQVRIREMLFSQGNLDKQGVINEMLKEMGKNDVSAGELNQDAVAAAMTLVSIVPILIVYPFMQKYFAAGMLKGSIKG